MQAARDVYQRFAEGGDELLHRAVSERWSEGPLLEFKVAENSSAPMTRADGQAHAEALSGFANSEGGVVVWGVEARRPSAGELDAAIDLHEIRDIDRFADDLQRLAVQVVSPRVVGVEHLAVEAGDTSGAGFAVTYVPSSDGPLHMARAKDQHRYYYRSGDSFLRMESYMVEDRLSRRPRPFLVIEPRVVGARREAGNEGDDVEAHVLLQLRNTGVGVALYPALTVQETAEAKVNPFGIDGNRNLGLQPRPRSYVMKQGGRWVFAGGMDDAIHPGTFLEVATLELKPNSDSIADRAIEVPCAVHCDGFSANQTVVIEGDRIVRLVTK